MWQKLSEVESSSIRELLGTNKPGEHERTCMTSPGETISAPCKVVKPTVKNATASPRLQI
jgi:hypothetical protein